MSHITPTALKAFNDAIKNFPHIHILPLDKQEKLRNMRSTVDYICDVHGPRKMTLMSFTRSPTGCKYCSYRRPCSARHVFAKPQFSQEKFDFTSLEALVLSTKRKRAPDLKQRGQSDWGSLKLVIRPTSIFTKAPILREVQHLENLRQLEGFIRGEIRDPVIPRNTETYLELMSIKSKRGI